MRKSKAKAPSSHFDYLFVGIDQSLTSTGLVCLDGAGMVVAQYNIVPVKGLKGVERLASIRQELRTFFSDLPSCGQMNIDMEGYSFASRFSHAHSLGELGGVIKLTLHEIGFLANVVPPQTLKKFVATDPKRAKKEHMIVEVYKQWGYDAANNDMADAYALAAFCAARTGRPWWSLRSRQREALAGSGRSSD